MNTPTRWQQWRDGDAIHYRSEHTFGGPIEVVARVENGTVVWDKPDDVPVFIAEDAARRFDI